MKHYITSFFLIYFACLLSSCSGFRTNDPQVGINWATSVARAVNKARTQDATISVDQVRVVFHTQLPTIHTVTYHFLTETPEQAVCIFDDGTSVKVDQENCSSSSRIQLLAEEQETLEQLQHLAIDAHEARALLEQQNPQFTQIHPDAEVFGTLRFLNTEMQKASGYSASIIWDMRYFAQHVEYQVIIDAQTGTIIAEQ